MIDHRIYMHSLKAAGKFKKKKKTSTGILRTDKVSFHNPNFHQNPDKMYINKD